MIDVYQLVSDRIIEALEKGVCPWNKPWMDAGGCISHGRGKRYSALNQLLLEGYSGEWATFAQISVEGGHVRKGEKSHPIVFWKMLEKIDPDTGEVTLIPFLRYYNVFHIDQCEHINKRYAAKYEYPDTADSINAADAVIADYVQRSGISYVCRESSEAFYSPSADQVVIPLKQQFTDTSKMYSTIFHELTHSTGSPKRLSRFTDGERFGSSLYSKEELVAEIGSAFILNTLGIETSASFENSTAYLQGWLSMLKNDNHLIVQAASKADKAVELILGKAEETAAPEQ